MLGKVSWWDKEAGVGTVLDVEGKEWHISDDMIDEDELKSSIKSQTVVNFEPNPSMENSGMRVSIGGPEAIEQYNKDQGASAATTESANKKANLTEAEAKGQKLNSSEVSNEAPYDLKEYVKLLLDHQVDTSVETVKETLEDDDALSELADSHVDIYTSDIWSWYAEDTHRVSYADEAIKDGIVTDDDGVIKILMVGQYVYHAEYLQKAKDWLEEYIEELPEAVEPDSETEVAEESIKRFAA